MSKKDLKLKIEEISLTLGIFRELEIKIGRIYDDDWKEPIGPTTFPSVSTFRAWDSELLDRYKPFCDARAKRWDINQSHLGVMLR